MCLNCILFSSLRIQDGQSRGHYDRVRSKLIVGAGSSWKIVIDRTALHAVKCRYPIENNGIQHHFVDFVPKCFCMRRCLNTGFYKIYELKSCTSIWLSEYRKSYEYQRSRILIDLCPRSLRCILSETFCCKAARPSEAAQSDQRLCCSLPR